MRTLKTITLSLFASTLALAACQARGTAPSPAASTPAATATPRIIVVTATWPAYPGPEGAATSAPPTAAPTVTAVAPTPASTQAPPTQAPASVPPTPDPNERTGNVIYEDRLDGSSRWMWSFHDDAATFGLEDGHLKGVANQSGAYWRFTLGPDSLSNGDQQLSVTAHPVACGPNDEYGLIFRAAEADGLFDLYAFNLTCGGLARFERISGTHAASVRDWSVSTAIKTGPGADNTLLVWMAGSEFRFYANGQYLFSGHDTSFTTGTYGFYLQDRTQGGLTVTFDDLVAKAVNPAASN
jgi:hypothetical protein